MPPCLPIPFIERREVGTFPAAEGSTLNTLVCPYLDPFLDGVQGGSVYLGYYVNDRRLGFSLWAFGCWLFCSVEEIKCSMERILFSLLIPYSL
jgi:hypothetical protein